MTFAFTNVFLFFPFRTSCYKVNSSWWAG